MTRTIPELRLAFFDYVYEERKGFVCIAHNPSLQRNRFIQRFFDWPEQKYAMGSYLDQIVKNNNVWFSVNQWKRPERLTHLALPTNLIWADLDYCNPGIIVPAPQCRIETSPGRWQALWRLEELITPEDAQAYSRRIAYGYAKEGADKSGWDITQLLRVPFTYNYKYDDGQREVPEVKLVSALEVRLPLSTFAGLTEPTPEETAVTDEVMPDVLSLPDVGNVLYAHKNALRRTAFNNLFLDEPAEDWSASMWHLINICLEVGMTTEETFAIALESKCNKYERDNRPISYLWREVVKAQFKQLQLTIVTGDGKPLQMPELIAASEPPASFIDTYKEWALDATDAIEEYHELAAVMLLSCLMSSGLYLSTSFGKVLPNLWGLVLGDSTLTRKTTAMRMSMDLVLEVDHDLVVATDGSPEGLLTAIAGRPSQVSVFFKDEVAGFIDAINRKDYLANLPETMTELYDVPPFLKRQLRKDAITITSPVFIFFGGGIRDKMYGLLNDQFVLSGFLPRFLIVSGDTDLTKIRPTGPLVAASTEKRRKLREQLIELYDTYSGSTPLEIPEANTTLNIPIQTEVTLSNDAWTYFQKIENMFAQEAHESPHAMLAQPTFGRLAWSCLKMAMLFAAARQKPKDGKISLGVKDLQAAAYYTQRWGRHTIDLILNLGQSASQRLIEKVYLHVVRRSGCPRSELSRNFHLTKKELDLILETLQDRGQIHLKKVTNGWTVHAL